MNKKIKTLLGMMVFAFAMIPLVNVRAMDVNDEATLKTALLTGGEITLTSDVTITSPLYAGVNTVINGAGHKITADPAFINDGSNGSILAIMSGAEVQLNDLTISDAKKYGVQAYDGGIVTFNGVTITKSGFGAVLLNGGGAAVIDLKLENNAYGIEFGKGANVNNDPALVMAGKINGTQTELFVLADNDNLGEVTVGNLADSEMKLAVDGKKLVLKNSDGTVLATSNEAKAGVVVKEEEVNPTPTPTPTPTPDDNASSNPETFDGVMSYIGLAILGFGALAISSKKLAKNN